VVKVEIWSDVVCPWCYVGKRQFEAALATFGHADQVSVEWRSFELDPSAPRVDDVPMKQILQRKYGMTEEQADEANQRMTDLAASLGLEYHLDRVQRGNTFDAHRLIHLAAEDGGGDAMKERLLAAYFTEGRAVGDLDTLAELAAEVGLDADQVEATLHSDRYAAEVRDDEAMASTLGASGVPFFVIDGTYGVSGAQGAEVILKAMERAWAESHPVMVIAGGSDDQAACTDGSCSV
jgi:predicted DsbA family dithiol-disulfide isomerase